MYWALRATLAPVVESLILVNRALYLDEAGVRQVSICPIFDPAISPRNFAIVANK